MQGMKTIYNANCTHAHLLTRTHQPSPSMFDTTLFHPPNKPTSQKRKQAQGRGPWGHLTRAALVC